MVIVDERTLISDERHALSLANVDYFADDMNGNSYIPVEVGMAFDLLRATTDEQKNWLGGIHPKTYWSFQASFWFAVFVWRTSYTLAHGYGFQGTGLRLISMLAAFLFTLGFTIVYLRFADERLRPGKLVLIVTVIVAVGFGHTFADRILYNSSENGWAFTLPNVDQYMAILSVNAWVFISWTGFFLMIHQLSRAQTQQVTMVQLEKLTKETRLELLQQQLHPHFLFNTLNSLSALILDGRSADADAMIVRLSRFLRRSIDTQNDPMTMLQDEINMITDYLEIQTMRYGERLNYKIEIEEDCQDICVPRMILQPLVENAVKHGIVSETNGGTISIVAIESMDSLLIHVRDTGPGFCAKASEKSGVGLCLIRERLNGLYGHDASLLHSNTPNGGACVTLRLPVEHAYAKVQSSAA